MLGLVHVFLVLSVVKPPLQNTSQRCALRQVGWGWQGVWEEMGRYVSPFLHGLEFAPYQMQNPKKLTECFKKVCPDPGNMKELELTALCWAWPVPIKRCSALFCTLKKKKMLLGLSQPLQQVMWLNQRAKGSRSSLSPSCLFLLQKLKMPSKGIL